MVCCGKLRALFEETISDNWEVARQAVFGSIEILTIGTTTPLWVASLFWSLHTKLKRQGMIRGRSIRQIESFRAV